MLKKQLGILSISIIVALFSITLLTEKYVDEYMTATAVIGFVMSLFGLLWFANLVIEQKQKRNGKN